jgi:hypothetical protein
MEKSSYDNNKPINWLIKMIIGVWICMQRNSSNQSLATKKMQIKTGW